MNSVANYSTQLQFVNKPEVQAPVNCLLSPVRASQRSLYVSISAVYLHFFPIPTKRPLGFMCKRVMDDRDENKLRT